jgi:hypothetical protein
LYIIVGSPSTALCLKVSKRVFSQAMLLITSQRYAYTIEATQCLGMWLIMNRKKVMGKDRKKQRKWLVPS